MKRRTFLTTGAVTGAAAVAAGTMSAPAISQGMKEMKLVTSYPKNFPGFGTSADRIARRITTATEGRVTVRLFNGGELVPPFGVFDAVSEGNAEAYLSADFLYPSKSQAFNFFTAVPFGLTTPETWAWLLYGGGYELWREVHADFGMYPFAASSTGIQMGGWFNRQIKTLDDFRGIKMRMPGLGGEVMRHIGVAVVNIPVGEIFPSLQSGALDGTEWVGPWHDLALGLYRVVKHYHWPGFHEPATVLSFVFNKNFWESLSALDREIISAILEAEVYLQSAEYDGRSPESLDTLVSEHGVQLHKYPDEVLLELGRISGEVVNEIGNSDPLTKKVWDSYRTFRKRAIGWSKISLQGYMNARTLPFAYD